MEAGGGSSRGGTSKDSGGKSGGSANSKSNGGGNPGNDHSKDGGTKSSSSSKENRGSDERSIPRDNVAAMERAAREKAGKEAVEKLVREGEARYQAGLKEHIERESKKHETNNELIKDVGMTYTPEFKGSADGLPKQSSFNPYNEYIGSKPSDSGHAHSADVQTSGGVQTMTEHLNHKEHEMRSSHAREAHDVTHGPGLDNHPELKQAIGDAQEAAAKAAQDEINKQFAEKAAKLKEAEAEAEEEILIKEGEQLQRDLAEHLLKMGEIIIDKSKAPLASYVETMLTDKGIYAAGMALLACPIPYAKPVGAAIIIGKMCYDKTHPFDKEIDLMYDLRDSFNGDNYD